MRLLAEIALITLAAIGVAVCVIVIPRRGPGGPPRSVRSRPRPDQLLKLERLVNSAEASTLHTHAYLRPALVGDRDAEAGGARLCAGLDLGRRRPQAARRAALGAGAPRAPVSGGQACAGGRRGSDRRDARRARGAVNRALAPRVRGLAALDWCRPRGRARRRAPRARDPDAAVRAAARRRSLAGRRTAPVGTVGARPDQGARRSAGPGGARAAKRRGAKRRARARDLAPPSI